MSPPKRAILQSLADGKSHSSALARAAALSILDTQRLVRELARDGLVVGGPNGLRITEAGRRALRGEA